VLSHSRVFQLEESTKMLRIVDPQTNSTNPLTLLLSRSNSGKTLATKEKRRRNVLDIFFKSLLESDPDQESSKTKTAEQERKTSPTLERASKKLVSLPGQISPPISPRQKNMNTHDNESGKRLSFSKLWRKSSEEKTRKTTVFDITKDSPTGHSKDGFLHAAKETSGHLSRDISLKDSSHSCFEENPCVSNDISSKDLPKDPR